MTFPRLASSVRLAPSWLALGVLVCLGCGDDSGVGKTFPVSGTVTLDGQPFNADTGTILFIPDRDRGNETPFEPAGTVDENGVYELFTRTKKGAPPGWYRVTVTGTEVAAEPPKVTLKQRPRPRSLVPAKYGQAKSTPLSVEVVERPTPGAYDLRLTSK